MNMKIDLLIKLIPYAKFLIEHMHLGVQFDNIKITDSNYIELIYTGNKLIDGYKYLSIKLRTNDYAIIELRTSEFEIDSLRDRSLGIRPKDLIKILDMDFIDFINEIYKWSHPGELRYYKVTH